jgi:hypothetical protein
MKHHYLPHLVFLLACLIFVGCDFFGSEDKSTRIQIRSEQSQYQVGQKVKFSATNESKESLFTQFCGPNLTFEIQRYDESWESHYATICPAIYAIDFTSVAKPGETFRFSNILSEEGEYRAKLTYKIGSEGEKQIGYSNTFTIEE